MHTQTLLNSGQQSVLRTVIMSTDCDWKLNRMLILVQPLSTQQPALL